MLLDAGVERAIPGEGAVGARPTCPSSISKTRLRQWRRWLRRAKVVEAIRKQEWDDRVFCVRVNAWDTEWTVGDVIEVVSGAGERLDEVMLPKVQRAAEVVALDLLLTQVEKTSGLPVGHIGIEAQIETVRGLINVEEICEASGRLETIIFGPADFAASMEMPVLTGGVADTGVSGRPLPLRLLQDPDGGRARTVCR